MKKGKRKDMRKERDPIQSSYDCCWVEPECSDLCCGGVCCCQLEQMDLQG